MPSFEEPAIREPLRRCEKCGCSLETLDAPVHEVDCPNRPRQQPYDFEWEAHKVCDAIGSGNGRMTVTCALHEAFDAGKTAEAGTKYHFNPRFHIEGGKLVKTSNGQPIPPDEPTFVIRGRDMLGVPIIAMYMQLAEREGCNEEFLAGVKQSLDSFALFAFEQASKMKEPGVTRGK